jgi:uncharacterized protein YrrD
MKIHEDAKVLSSEGKTVGELDRVVVDPKTKEVTHLVVEQGILFTEDRVVPMSMVQTSDEEKITLRATADELEELPEFEETEYMPLDEQARSEFPVEARSLYYLGKPFGIPPMTLPDRPVYKRTEKNIPDDAIDFEDGAKVLSVDEEHIGDVEQILTHPETDQVTHFIISKGLLLKERKLIPTNWISVFGDDEIRLAVGSRIVEQLPVYEK